MNTQIIDSLTHINGDSSREGLVECTYNLLQTDEESVPVEGTDLHLVCPDQEVAVVSTSLNIGVQISLQVDNLTAKDQSENWCCPHSNGLVQSVLLPMADNILSNDDGGEEPIKEVSSFLPQQLQSPTTLHIEDPSESRCLLTESNSAIADSIVLKKLLRRSRYFDSGSSCLEEDRVASPPVKKLRKLCYLCGQLNHDAKKCPKRRACYTCKRKGHFAVDCPLSIEESDRICLRCGETGHEISSCNNDYCLDDLKKLHCYVCNDLGHIYCENYVDSIGMATVSCYNCGESRHSGLQCPKPLVDKCGTIPPAICYKCGEQGHLARNCISSSKGGQGVASRLAPETEEGDEHENRKRARTSRSIKNGRPRRRKLKGLVDCMTVS